MTGKPLTKDQLALLRYYSDGRECSIPYNLRPALRPLRRAGLIENTGRTSGIANTSGGVQWLFRLTDAGRRALASTGAPHE